MGIWVRESGNSPHAYVLIPDRNLYTVPITIKC